MNYVWTFESLPDIELLDLYDLQFVAYKKTTGPYDAMMEHASEVSSDDKAKIAMERSSEKSITVQDSERGGEKCQEKVFSEENP